MLFSVIIPVYNVEMYVKACIRSVVEQVFPTEQYEIIVVNDCSPDSAIDIVKSMQPDVMNLRVVEHDTNKHLGGGRNTGMKVAKGEYVLFLDSDDCWLHNHVLSMFKAIIDENRNIDIIKSTRYCSFIGTVDLNAHKEAPRHNMQILNGKEYIMSDRYFSNVWTGCYRRDFLQFNQLKFREHVAYEDSDWTLAAFWQAEKIGLIDDVFYCYRNNPESITNKPNLKVFEDNIKSIYAVDAVIRDNGIYGKYALRSYERIKKSILSYIRITRNYPIADSFRVLAPLRHSRLMSVNQYVFSLKERLLFTSLQYCPVIVIVTVKIMTYIKRRILKCLKK